jgi:hypothetical protein
MKKKTKWRNKLVKKNFIHEINAKNNKNVRMGNGHSRDGRRQGGETTKYEEMMKACISNRQRHPEGYMHYPM